MAATPHSESAQPPSGIRRILACDDERHILRLIEVNLSRQGHEIVCAADGDLCLRRLRTETFDVLILDADLRDPTADDVLAAIRQDERHAGMKIVLLDSKSGGSSGSGGGPLVVRIAKPFSPGLLVSSL